ncbi:MAG TPA: hypothetical protein VJU87_08160 [Gemmatimonadaceae bacterium]|nr:hypothetical protein [Gemmatimonadaceae bacterium]
MFVGHLGLAFLGKRLRPAAALGWLAVAAFLPDFVRVGLRFVVSSPWADFLSHSIPSVVILAAAIGLAAGMYAADWRVGALAGALCVSHLAADYLTGCKPTWLYGPYLGAYLYHFPIRDLLLELPLIFVAWLLLRQVLPARAWLSRAWLVLLLALAQVAMVGWTCFGSSCKVGGVIWKGTGDSFLPKPIGNPSEIACPGPEFTPPWVETE